MGDPGHSHCLVAFGGAVSLSFRGADHPNLLDHGGCWRRRVFFYIAVDLQADAMEALALMIRTGSGRLMVTAGNRLPGIMRLKDMMKFFELKVELEP